MLVLRCGLAGVVWYPDAGFSMLPQNQDYIPKAISNWFLKMTLARKV